MDLDLKGKALIVSGGTSGLGLATAQALLAEGANVLVTGRDEGKIGNVRDVLGDAAKRLAFEQGDNADPELPGRLGKAVHERWGRLDGMLISGGGPSAGKAMETSDDAWRAGFESFFLGPVRLIRELAPQMESGGAIALVLAISAKEMAPTLPISDGLRPGLAMLVKTFADELGPRGIRVNALLPNLFATDRMKQVLADKPAPVDRIALKRIGEPDELGRMAAILLSPAASYVTGASLSVDGGQLKAI